MTTERSDARDMALRAHENYYAHGTFHDDRLAWTIENFLPQHRGAKVLEVGCGDGAMLRLLTERGADAVGVDASASGVERCLARGVRAQCLDVSSDGLPYANDSFDVVISLETFEHLMNPHYAIQEVRRVLRPQGRFICSVPNPRTHHPYLYPGLFEYGNFRRFLQQEGFVINSVRAWQWAPREAILPAFLRGVPVLNGRIFAGGLRRVVEISYRFVGGFPYFCYWLWTFDCRKDASAPCDPHKLLCEKTRPGSPTHFAASH
jgi:SAM-dependent methyltransferase